MHEKMRGHINDDFTLNIDIAPTILSLAGIPVPDFMQGSDISELYMNATGPVAQSWRQDFFYEFNYGDPVTAEDDVIPILSLPFLG